MKFPVALLVLALVITPGSAATLDDLKKLEITCFVPGWLPDGLRLTKVDVRDDAAGPDADAGRHFPVYQLEYDDGHGRTFSIDSAWEGIGDRNIMEEEDSEETAMASAVGKLFIIYRPKGREGPKAEILTNWVYDDEMQKQMKEKNSKPTLGRFHGFSASGVTLAEFQRIMNSVHPVRVDKTKPQVAATPPPKIHPKVFNLIDCWLSDSEAPVVTEINLDAVAKDGNEFQDELVKEEAGWIRCPTADTNGGFMRYRVVEQKGDRYKIEYQENGGGSLTTTSTIEFVIDKREVSRDGKSETMRVLRVVGYQHNY